MQVVVETKLHAGDACDELDGAIVVRRSETSGDHAEIGAESVPQRVLELLLAVPDDLDPRRLEAELQDLAREKRTVTVGPVAADQLASRYDEDGPRAIQAPGRIPRAVTISVFGPPTGSLRTCPF